jgi:hypothetical protein
VVIFISILALALRYWYVTIILFLCLSFFDDKNQKSKSYKPLSSTQASKENSSNEPLVQAPKEAFKEGNKNKLKKGFEYPFFVVHTSKGKCSGFAINNDYLITAYHCVANFDYVSLLNPSLPTYDKERLQEGIVVDYNNELDIALIKGNFEFVQKYYMNLTDNFKYYDVEACGAPEHREVVDCFKFKNIKVSGSLLSGEGFSRSGLSGSILLSRDLEVIHGVLIGTVENKTLFVRIDKVLEKFDISQNDVNRLVIEK